MYLNGKRIVVNASLTARYLGVTLDRALSFSAHCMKAASAASIRVRQLQGCCSTSVGASIQSLRTFYKGYIESALLYGASTFASSLHDAGHKALATVHRRGIRAYTGLPSAVPDDDLLLEGYNLPLEILGKLRAFTTGKMLSGCTSC